VLPASQDGGVLTLTLNRPHRKNALDAALWVALRDALTAAGHDSSMRALVLSGADARAAFTAFNDKTKPVFTAERTAT
jgi:2-(1,2-epoxy-1,2-dihydrophenyl)acetyl-CoA isomerase